MFPDKLKIARVTSLYKTDDSSDLTNYRLISALPCFSKILERTMYNRLFSYVSQEKIPYSKQFGFQSGHSTEHTILQLANQPSKPITCSKLTIETLEQGVKYLQS